MVGASELKFSAKAGRDPSHFPNGQPSTFSTFKVASEEQG